MSSRQFNRMTYVPAFVVSTVALAALFPATGRASEANTLTEIEKAQGWRLLFDGKTTSGWRGYKMKGMPEGWKVIDGALVRVSGGEGGKGAGGGDDIITIEEFGDFELEIEWKIVAGGNSGILYWVSEEAVTSWHTAPEMQVLDNAKHPNHDRRQLAGACYDLYAPTKDVVRPAETWNHARIVAVDRHVEHWLNGEKIVEYEWGSDDWHRRVVNSKFKDKSNFARRTRGHICLQDHTDRVAFRNIRIRKPRPAGQRARNRAGAAPGRQGERRNLVLELRSRALQPGSAHEYREERRTVRWDSTKTAVIVCDM